SADFFTVPEAGILDIESLLTVVGGRVVHGQGDYETLAPALPRPMPDWSPVNQPAYSGGTLAQAGAAFTAAHRHGASCGVHGDGHAAHHDAPADNLSGFWG